MKKRWEYRKLREVATFTRGLTYSKNDEAELSNNIVLRSNNVDLSTGKLNFDELKYLRPEFSIPEDKIVKKGSLLMCMSNGSKIHLGKVALIDEDYPYAFGGFMALVTPNEELNPNFFLYSLSSPDYKGFIKKLSAGANINNIKVKELELFTIPVPPLSEQQSIVDYLDSAFAKIDAMKANAEKALNEAKALFQASLKEMLEPKEGWKEKKLSDLYDVRDGTHDSPKYHETGYPLVTSKNLRGGILDMSNVSFISEEDYNAINNRSKVDIGDVLFAMIGTIGNPVYIQEKPNYAIKNMALFKVPSNQSGEFLRYYLLNDNVLLKMQIESKGTTQKFVSLGYLRNFLIKIPDLSVQQSIVTSLDSLKSKVDRLQANYEKISQECDALKQAILRQVFE